MLIRSGLQQCRLVSKRAHGIVSLKWICQGKGQCKSMGKCLGKVMLAQKKVEALSWQKNALQKAKNLFQKHLIRKLEYMAWMFNKTTWKMGLSVRAMPRS